MVFFAVLSFVGFMELGLPFWAALPVTVALMVVVGMATERFVLRPLVSQSEDTLLMATIGLAFVIEGVAQLVWGVDVRRLDLGIQRRADRLGAGQRTGMLISQLDITAAARRGRHGRSRWRCCSRAPRSGAACAPSPTTTRRRCRSASR